MIRSMLVAMGAGSVMALAACSAPQQPTAAAQDPPAIGVTLERAIRMDGQFDDWPADAAAAATGEYLYFRLQTPELVTLQAAEQTYALQVDLDASAATGRAVHVDAADQALLGVDLEVQFSPFAERRGRQPERGQAVRVLVAAAGADMAPVSHAAAGLLVAPTHSSDEFEIRLSREALAGLLPHLKADAAAARFIALDRRGRQTAAWPTVKLALPTLENGSATIGGALPRRGVDELRIVTLNVEYAATMTNPAPFGRILRALNPDIVLIQEWDKGDEYEISSWFREHVPPASGWQCMRSEGWGVAIVSRHPMRRLGPELLTRPDDAPPDTHIPDRAIRFVGALVNTPLGDVATASVHLKCCGHDGSEEDLARLAEARLINEVFAAGIHEVCPNGPTPLRVIGGDLNLVGSRDPLGLIGAGLDADGSDLEAVEPWVTGDAAQYTWMNSESSFTPGRLDYVLVGDAGLEVSRSFVLDTARLSEAALAAHGLERADSAASDHRPIVVDVRNRHQNQHLQSDGSDAGRRVGERQPR